jgi:hypothetical protein
MPAAQEGEDSLVVLARPDDAAEGGKEREVRDAEPIRPGAPHARFADQGLAHIDE